MGRTQSMAPKKTPAKKTPAKKTPAKRGGDPECSSGSMFEKKAAKVSGKRNRVLSRIMMDDEYQNSDSIPSSKLQATLPKKRKPKPKKKIESSDDEDEPPKKKASA